MKLLNVVIVLLLLLSAIEASGQYYETGQDPAFLKWEQINSEHFKIVFPDSYSQQASRYAVELEKAYGKLINEYPVKKVFLPVVLHSYSIVSNGYVSWAPKRMEIYPLPDQDNIPMDQAEQLALHEFNHGLQIQSLNQGFSKGMSFLLGEQFTGALSAYLPMWYLEGDAVHSETQFSASGRGENPAFNKQMKALLLEKNAGYKYDKMLAGSFKHFVPDHYRFGYQLVAWSRNNYPGDLWNNVLLNTAKNPFSFNPVNFSLRRNDNLTKKKIFYSTIENLLTEWKEEEKGNPSLDYKPLNPDKKKEYINYYSPVEVGTDSIIAIKTSLYNPPKFVLITDSGNTEVVFHTPGSIYPYLFSYKKGMIVWAETQPDARWENRGYSVIKAHDLKTKKTSQVTRKSRLMAPSISPDGLFVAAAESTPEYQNNLVVIDIASGLRIKTIPTPENVFPQRPQWSADGTSITIIYLASDGEGILVYNNISGFWKTLLPTSRNDVQSAYLRNDSLFFVSSVSGTDNIYIKELNENVTRITSSRFGAYDLNLNNSSLLFTNYTSDGYEIGKVSFNDPVNIIELPGGLKENPANLKQAVESSGRIGDVIDTLFKPEPYNKFKNLFGFHSWMPFYADIEKIQSDPLSVKPGITLLSQNLLSTLTSSVGYEYNNKKHILHTKFEWKGWYPIIRSDLSLGGDPLIIKGARTVVDPYEIHKNINLVTDLILPLNFSNGNYSQIFRPSISVAYQNRYIFIPEQRTFDNGQVRVTGRFYLANYGKSSLRDIYPKFGQVVDYNYSFSPFDKTIYGPVSTLKTALFLPGIIRNQGLRLRFETEEQLPEMFLQYNRASFPRGYSDIISEKYKFYSADYAIPLFYPDFNIMSLIYLKRIRTTLFYDYAEGTGNSYIATETFNKEKVSFNSVGFELLSDFYLLRIPFMMSAGVQTSYLPSTQSTYFKLVFNIDVFGLQINRSKM